MRAYEALDRAVLRRSEGVLVLSAAYQEELRGLGVPQGRTHLLPSGIDVEALRGTPRKRDLRAELGISARTPVAGIVARLSPEKGHRDFLFCPGGGPAGARKPGDRPADAAGGADHR